MILLLFKLSLACDTESARLHLSTSAFREDYLCLARATSGRSVLLPAIEAEKDPDIRARYTRALSLWLLERGDQTISAEDARLLSADDRRLVADGIYARAGRPSPSPLHAQVFEQQDWYHPDPRYTDGRLSPLDRANIARMDKPPDAPPPPPPPPTEITPEAPPPQAEEKPTLFGCTSAPASPWLALLVIAYGFRKYTTARPPSQQPTSQQ